jgi:predicted Fe-Mo cluster-binding NifX family protein
MKKDWKCLEKEIDFYRFSEGTLTEIVENPVMRKIKLDKASEGARHLGVGHIIPAFLKQKSVDVFVTHEFGKNVTDNLLALGITPVVPHSRNIDEIVEMLKQNQQTVIA